MPRLIRNLSEGKADMRKNWRFLDTGANSGAFNMALDEAILNNKAGNPGLIPTLRVFRWKPACLSIGENQMLKEVNLERCRELGIDVVRRLTGGTAVLHKEELTYSIVISEADGAPLEIQESFALLNQGLIAAYKILGVETNLVFHPEKNYTPSCFASTGLVDLTHQGKKIVGSARKKRKGTILQHGALVIKHDLALMLETFNLDRDQKEKMFAKFLAKTTDLETVRGKTSWQEIKEAIQRGFQEAFGLNFIDPRLEAEELLEAKRLLGNYQKLEARNAFAPIP